MEIVIKILQFILSLSLLVFIHELGHFLFARMFGIKVDKFYIFFDAWGFSLVKFKIGDTQFGIGWIPFGGYCKISGMIDESLDMEQMKSEPQPWEFRSKPAWQRLLVMTGGVIMNVVLAALIYIGISHRWGDQYYAAEDVRWGYMFSDLGHGAGFADGDKVLAVGGVPVEGNWRNLPLTIALNNQSPIEVERDGQRVTVQITAETVAGMLKNGGFISPRVPFVIGEVPEGTGAYMAGMAVGDSLVAVNGRGMMFLDEYTRELESLKGQTADVTFARDSAGVKVLRTLPVTLSADGKLGVLPYDHTRFMPVRTLRYTLPQSIPAGIDRAGNEISNYWKQVKLIFQPKTEAHKSVGGLLSIGSMFPGEWAWKKFWELTAFLSIALAVINILPIPALDGGHVLFLLWEVVTRRKPSDKFLEYTQIAGLFIVLALLLVTNGNDIYRLFIKHP